MVNVSSLLRPALCLALLTGLLLPEAALADNYFPWTCRKTPVTAGKTPGMPQGDLQGEWISSFDPGRVLDIREQDFALQGTGGNLSGSIQEAGPSLLLTDQHGTQCVVLWQLLGDGRLSLNSGEDLFHRRGDPAVPSTTVRQYGNPECRFTISLPSKLPVKEIENGVQIFTIEKDGAMMILSGRDKAPAEKFARGICTTLQGKDFTTVDEDKTSFTFSAVAGGVPMDLYVTKHGEQYLQISLMGAYNKLLAYLKTITMVPSTGEAGK